MTLQQRNAFFGIREKKPYRNERVEMVKAQMRGEAIMREAKGNLAGDIASSASRKRAAAVAQAKNGEAIKLLAGGACRAFNPLARKS